MAGVIPLRHDGFEPVEEHTGAEWIVEVWPLEHRPSVVETRPMHLEYGETDGRLWLVRSPWPSLSVDDIFEMLWPWAERDRPRDGWITRARAAELLGWDAARAVAWRREVADRFGDE